MLAPVSKDFQDLTMSDDALIAHDGGKGLMQHFSLRSMHSYLRAEVFKNEASGLIFNKFVSDWPDT